MRTRSPSLLVLVSALFGVPSGCDRAPESPPSVTSADGARIAYEVTGTGTPALVFVHGWSCDRTYWEAQVPHFSPEHEVVTIDLAGHGESGLERNEWSMRAFGQDVAAVVEHLDLGPVILVGHSMGGPVSVEAARLLGDRVEAIIGVDTFNDLRARYSVDQVATFLEPFRADFPGATETLVRSFFVPASDPALVERVVADMTSAPPEVGMGAIEELNAWARDESTEAFRSLTVPVRVINSDYTPTNVQAGRDYTASFDAVFMAGVGHFVMMEDPDTFNRLLAATIQDLSGDPED